MNGKHTIKQNDWWNYPVLQKYYTPFTYKDNFVHIKIMTGIQDEIPVLGYYYNIKSSGGGGCNPGRKWGEFNSLVEAEDFGLNYILNELTRKTSISDSSEKKIFKAVLAIKKKKAELKDGVQMTLNLQVI